MSVKKAQPIRFVAAFELIKGTFVLTLSLVIFFMRRWEPDSRLVDIVNHLKLDIVQNNIVLLLFGFLYCSLRFTEGYGLWEKKKWGATIGIVSTVMYLPFEFYELYEEATTMKLLVTFINIFILIYLIRWRRT